MTIAAASIADFASIIALTLFFSREATGAGTKLLLLGGFAALAAPLGPGAFQELDLRAAYGGVAAWGQTVHPESRHVELMAQDPELV